MVLHVRAVETDETTPARREQKNTRDFLRVFFKSGNVASSYGFLGEATGLAEAAGAASARPGLFSAVIMSLVNSAAG